jgi:anti-sigma B factor antagonist
MQEPHWHHLNTAQEQGVLVITLKGRDFQDEQTAQAILNELHRAVTQYAADKVIIDFQNIKYISSVAFRPLLSLRRKMQELNGRLMLCSLSKLVGDVFYTTKLVDTSGTAAAPFEMAPDVPSAIDRLTNKVTPP